MLAHLAVLDPQIWSRLGEPVVAPDGWFEKREREITQDRTKA